VNTVMNLLVAQKADNYIISRGVQAIDFVLSVSPTISVISYPM
jgi:hypothetical protein